MAKTKTVFLCTNCGNESMKWMGKCPACGEWNTLVEEHIKQDKKEDRKLGFIKQSEPVKIEEISGSDSEQRIVSDDNEFNRVLGGGIVKGSIVLVGGEPGIGKSTLMLQIAIALNDLKVLYVSGEESRSQIKMRYDRIKKNTSDNLFLLNETDIDIIFDEIKKLNPDILIIDSIQTIYNTSFESSAGSIMQIRECTAAFQQYAKSSQVPVFLIGHITKDGTIAGPKILEHIVDTVIMFEGERNYGYRILRTIKNRFGSASELGMYFMQQSGLVQVNNPSEVLLSNNTENLSGISIGATIEGMRPIIVEVQALVGTSAFGAPQRTTTGFDVRRLNMLLAVLEKRCNFKLSAKDVFLNIAGGIRIDDPAIDLAVVSAVLSSAVDMPLNHDYCFAGEIGLAGEVRPVTHIEKRISEAEKIGFNKMIISGHGIKKLDIRGTNIEIIGLNRIDEVFRYLFG
ncbi:DNA repair protein RadA [Bacteroidales bacterium OttesenSCG-928-K03]|nr:DNA repair protein RadA [Odoribacter sp. OttesenSCG-928-L07]MDL2239359.1 DNA repair protein RadA [Bacteroidales bacterium OttesenSCG-928-L14]MDL2240574.1 DNA repair protein RadA [Bacteroidales bacterium OttesenSCG-928-K22]MDL2242365.1 DNA repair protein RadA [Bacteroidales bacterium OttesenSCG-928-K03]